jgi:hypothetical protein
VSSCSIISSHLPRPSQRGVEGHGAAGGGVPGRGWLGGQMASDGSARNGWRQDVPGCVAGEDMLIKKG